MSTNLEPNRFYDVPNQYIQENLKSDPILACGARLLLVPTYLVVGAIEIIIGSVMGIGAICTLGKYEKLNKCFVNHLDSATTCLPFVYTNILQIINKDPAMRGCLRSRSGAPVKLWMYDWEQFTGFTSNIIKEKYLCEKLDTFYTESNFINRNITSRLGYILLAVAYLVTRTVDGIIGVIAALLSILTLGEIESINNIAARALEAPSIISDLFRCTVKFINPGADVGFVTYWD